MSVALAAHAVAQAQQTTPDQPRRFDGSAAPGIRLPDDRMVPLFVTAPTTESPVTGPANVNQDEILASVALEGTELRKGVEAAAVTVGMKMLFSFTDTRGVEADSMLLVTAYPQNRAGRRKIFKKPVTFTPGALTRLADVIARFGQPTETQVWSSEAAKDLGLDGVVHWWGEVGVSAFTDGSITHVLLRRVIRRQ